MEDEEYRSRPEDQLVEPFLEGLAPRRPGAEARAPAGRGCGRAALLVLVLEACAWLLAAWS
jgi:hypothetical protein